LAASVKIGIVFLFAVLILGAGSSVPGVRAASTIYVDLWVAYDEEFQSTAQSFYGYSPQTLAHIIIDSAFYYFCDVFDVYYRISTYSFWDSDDSLTDSDPRLDECMDELGWLSGCHEGVEFLVAFTDQESLGWYGTSDKLLGAVLVTETYKGGVGQATDNVLQHELSHLYGAQNHEVQNLTCVMNYYRYWIGFPHLYYVPTALVTNSWCDNCTELIASHREDWGTGSGGGGGGGWEPPRMVPYGGGSSG